MQIRRRVAGLALAASLAGTVVAAPAVQATEYPNFSAECHLSGNSTFVNDGAKAAYFSWTWRDGYTVLGYGAVKVSAGATKTLATPGGATGTTRFGVVKGNGAFAYVTCV